MAPSKAPGLDGLPNAAVKTAIREHPQAFVRVFNDLLERGEFPRSWKEARLVLVTKPGKPPGDPSASRPLLLEGAVPKLFERCILERLNEHLEDSVAPQLSPEQYGFRRGKSTIQAIQRVIERGEYARSFHRTNGRDPRCLVVAALDVQNAFNSASWRAIAAALREKNVPAALQRILRSYFSERELVYETSEGPVRRPVSAGVPQGSIIGPTLWNTLYDGVLRLAFPDGVEAIGFADDLVVLAGGTTPQTAAQSAQEAIAMIGAWMAERHLKLAPAKTEIIMVSTMRQGYQQPTVAIEGVQRQPTRCLKYLGVVLHDHLLWTPHVEYATAKALRVAKGISRLMQNHGGPKGAKRRLLSSVVDSTLRYAAPVWHEATNVRRCSRLLKRVQAQYVRPVARTFISVRYEVATVLASVIPICLQIREDARCHQQHQVTGSPVHQLRIEERAATLRQWQAEWDALAPASRFTTWAHRVIPDIAAWKNRRFGEMTFHLAQVISGHGFFHEYLHVQHFSPSPDCARCPGVAETAAHAFFDCPRFADVRIEVLGEREQEVITPDNLQAFLLSSRENWSAVCEVAKRITTALQQEWYVERSSSAHEEMTAAARRLDTAHEDVVAARNDRRNEARRQLTVERRRARGEPPPPTHPDGRLLSEEEIREREERLRIGREKRVMQVNLGGGRTAQDLALQTARTKRVDVLLLSEVYRPPEGSGNWTVDSSGRAAVVATGHLPIQRVWRCAMPGLAAAQIGGVVFISCYAPPRLNAGEFEQLLEAVELEAQPHPRIVLAGDFNAWNEEWGSQRTTRRGEELLDTIRQLGLVILNQGSVPTFVGNGVATPSVVDVSFASASIARPDTWAGYRVVMSRLRGCFVPPETDRVVLERIANDLFPTHPPVDWPDAESSSVDTEERSSSLTPVTVGELLSIVGSMANRKAPGLDGIPNAAVKTAIRKYPEVFVRLYQDCLDRGAFPAPWKRQRLVLLPKPGKPPGESSSYRPLCMLDALGKVLERLILNRLNEFLEEPDAERLSDGQYGFRRGRSTISAIQRVVEAGRTAMSFRRTNARDKRCLMVVALDIRNAFNSAPWQAIANALRDKGVPSSLQQILRSYFEDRRLVIDTSEGPVERNISAGVPQGSILGPTLWNVLYDGVLGVQLPEGAEVIGYADDLVVLVPATTPQAASSTAERAIAVIMDWLDRNRLSLAPEKTEMTLISTLKRHPVVSINIGGVVVQSQRSIRYLGVWLHDHLSWLPHVQQAAAKAMKVAEAVTRLMPNHSGPKSSRARLLAAVADSILRYGAPVWSEGLQLRQCRRLVQRVQRTTAIRVCRAFRTVRGETAVLLAGLIPICLQIEEDSRVHQRLNDPANEISRSGVRELERDRTFEQWQQRWDADAASEDASRYTRWTHRVLPDVRAWQSRKHGDVTFQLAQVLSGHGFFRDYLCRMGFTSSPDCPRCPGVAETAEHVVFCCPRFAAEREVLFEAGRSNQITPEGFEAALLESPERWSGICEFVARITDELQDGWNAEREELAAQDQLSAARLPDNSVAIARNQRRNVARNAARARARELQRGGRPPSPPPSPTTAARRAAIRERVARFRERRRSVAS
ncbi:uncharacterized protein LOC125773783, partial [Anopheles funestus]|uniref:uncharacterized protein LOC125773783 n=1 Tax=Anopheles funestus TaxID=62324 RepID=UPI0020C5EB30